MYYKLTDTSGEMYKKLYAMRKKELRIEKENEEKIKERFPDWNKQYLGYSGQQNFSRVSQYTGLCFKNPEKVNVKEWKRHKEHQDVFIPNTRTKEGKLVVDFFKSLKSSSFFELRDIVGMELYGQFKIPYMEIGKDDYIYFYFDDRFNPSEEFIEITKKEFEAKLKS